MSAAERARPPAPAVFDVCGPLPVGTTVLEASAGTGKTHAIASLATRYLAEGVVDLSGLLVVTFGRAATSEVRERVRDRVVATARALGGPAPEQSAEPLVRLLGDAPEPEVARRRARLAAARAGFDGAAITTTHGFCQHMLTSLGVLADADREPVFVPDVADLLRDVVDDAYLQRWSGTDNPPLTPSQARAVAAAAVGDPHARLEPADAEASPGADRYAFARDVRAELVRRKRLGRLLDYDDLLVLLRDALVHPVHGPAAVARVRSHSRVVLVDEFQDTDPVQWQILRTAFHGHTTLVLIGDPKQAIYAFRGADVSTYLTAREDAHTTATLARNWRSDRPLLSGLDRLFRGAALGDPRILVRPIEAAHTGSRLAGAPPVRLRQVTRRAVGAPASGRPPAVGRVRAFVADDVAADIVRLLTSQARLRTPSPDGGAQPEDGAHPEDSGRPVRPGDVAVLTRRNEDAEAVREALVAVGVPAVRSGASSVFATPAARHWLTLLVALEQPGRQGRAAAVALTPFVGWDGDRLGAASDADRDALADRLTAWSRALASGGVGALFEATRASGLAERLMSTRDGERLLVDLRHIAEALHAAATAGGLGPAAVLEWLRARVCEAAEDYADERSRRLETDAEAVQVVTVHASKGLEFPIVYVPFAWDRFVHAGPDPLRYHDDGARVLHVGGPGSPGYADRLPTHRREEQGEDLRLLYVALTRAASQVVVWWAPSTNSPRGPLTRVLLGAHAPGEALPDSVAVGRDEAVTAALRAVADSSGGTVAVEVLDAAAPAVRWERPASEPGALELGRFARRIDAGWSRTSYTRITAPAHTQPGPGSVTSESEPGAADELEIPAGPAAALEGAPPGHLRSPMADLPGGTAFGTVVHRVLERLDPTATDLDAALRRACAEAAGARLAGVGAADLAAALGPVLTTPLGPLAEEVTLRDISPADRLTELEFEVPLAGGDTPRGQAATLAAITGLLRRHLPPGDPLAPYAERLDAAGLGDGSSSRDGLRGYLTGSLDAVLRVRGEESTRYLVVDYKTNRLAPASVDLSTAHYTPEAMAEAMMAAHYPLQLLLYSVALHRYLRWRQPRYDPEVHLGGGLYLFVRGMAGPATPRLDGTPCGVFAWRPPTALVVTLSALLDGRRP